MCRAGLLASLLLFVGGGQFGFRVSSAGGLLLTFVAHCGTTRCLRHTVGLDDCWVWSAVRCPNLGAAHDPLGTRVWDFPSVVGCSPFEKAACAASPRAAAASEDTTHTSEAALRPGTAAGAIRSARLDGVNARIVASRGFSSAADFSALRLGYPNLPSALMTKKSCGAWTLPAHASKLQSH